MGDGLVPRIPEVNPEEAWSILENDPKAVLIDVRTQAEWGFVGIPDLGGLSSGLIFVEWSCFPDMSVNSRFVAEMTEKLEGNVPSQCLFICRSGARSLRAAEAVASHLSETGGTANCFNVAEGFEGDLNASGHRGTLNGWKSRGLAWRQS
jgi:rhodanese-related sulfurtransferase